MDIKVKEIRFKVIHSSSPEDLERDLNDWVNGRKNEKSRSHYIEDIKIVMTGNGSDCFATICYKTTSV